MPSMLKMLLALLHTIALARPTTVLHQLAQLEENVKEHEMGVHEMATRSELDCRSKCTEEFYAGYTYDDLYEFDYEEYLRHQETFDECKRGCGVAPDLQQVGICGAGTVKQGNSCVTNVAEVTCGANTTKKVNTCVLESKLEEKIGGLETEVGSLTTQNADLTKQNADLKNAALQNDNLKKQIADLTKQNADLQTQNADLTKQNADLKNAALQNDNLKKQIADLTKQNADLQTQNDEVTCGAGTTKKNNKCVLDAGGARCYPKDTSTWPACSLCPSGHCKTQTIGGKCKRVGFYNKCK